MARLIVFILYFVSQSSRRRKGARHPIRVPWPLKPEQPPGVRSLNPGLVRLTQEPEHFSEQLRILFEFRHIVANASPNYPLRPECVDGLADDGLRVGIRERQVG